MPNRLVMKKCHQYIYSIYPVKFNLWFLETSVTRTWKRTYRFPMIMRERESGYWCVVGEICHVEGLPTLSCIVAPRSHAHRHNGGHACTSHLKSLPQNKINMYKRQFSSRPQQLYPRTDMQYVSWDLKCNRGSSKPPLSRRHGSLYFVRPTSFQCLWHMIDQNETWKGVTREWFPGRWAWATR